MASAHPENPSHPAPGDTRGTKRPIGIDDDDSVSSFAPAGAAHSRMEGSHGGRRGLRDAARLRRACVARQRSDQPGRKDPTRSYARG